MQEGDSPTFDCVYKDGYGTPYWRVNGTEYYWNRLPPIYTLHLVIGNFSITVSEATFSISGTSYQCVVDGLESRIGYLFVNTPLLSFATEENVIVSATSTSMTANKELGKNGL